MTQETVTQEDVAQKIEEFVRTQYVIGPDDPGFARDIDLFDLGYVDSVGLVELLAFINSHFTVEISEDDLLSEEFSTIHGMAKIVCCEWDR